METVNGLKITLNSSITKIKIIVGNSHTSTPIIIIIKTEFCLRFEANSVAATTITTVRFKKYRRTIRILKTKFWTVVFLN